MKVSTDKLNILIITYHFPPEWAGPVERFLRYVPGFEKRGVNLHFITRKQNNHEESNEMFRGASVSRLTSINGKYNFEYFLWKASQYVFTHRKDYQLAIYMSYSYTCIPFNWLLRLVNFPIIALHTMAVQFQENSIKNKLIKWLSVASLKSHQYAISSTAYLKQNMAEIGFPKNRIEIISNGVDLNRFHSLTDIVEKIQIKKDLNLNSEFNVLFVGLKSPRKGVLPLVKAWKIYKEKYKGMGSLLLVGPERRSYNDLEEFYKEWDRETSDAENYQIQLLGSAKNIEQYFQVCDIFVFLSNLEGLPNVLPESMACGIPILMNPYEGFSEEVAIPNKNVILTTREPEQIAEDLSKLAADSDKLNQLSQDAIQWVRKHHDVEVSLDKFCTFFHKVRP